MFPQLGERKGDVDFAEPAIPLTARMQDWIRITEPYEAFQGIVSVAEIAQWYDTHEDRLFDRNIRKPLGITQVNQGLIDTLTADPHNFWFFNNGITVLCDAVDPEYFHRGARRSPVTLNLDGASVVNGAQTVHAIHLASRKDAEAIADGYVTVRVISLKSCPPGFADAVTTATNTQNRVERRDFVALDPVQRSIREDFLLSLQKTYSVKRGEPEPAPENGCSVETAAIALACAHRNSDLAGNRQPHRTTVDQGDPGHAPPRTGRCCLWVGALDDSPDAEGVSWASRFINSCRRGHDWSPMD